MQLVVFLVGRQRYALPIDRVQEIIRVQPQTAGLISLRGRLLPVRDVAARIGAPPLEAAEPKIVVVELAAGAAGLLVDGVDSVVELAEDRLAPVPADLATNLFLAIARTGDDLVLVLDAERVLRGVLPEPEPKPEPKPRRRQPSRKRSEKATRSTGGAATGSPSSVTA